MGVILFYVILGAWATFENALRARDRARGAGDSRDRGTRRLLAVLVVTAMAVSVVLAATLANSPLRLPGYPWTGVAGLTLVGVGLAIRIWAVAELGRSFTTTLEVDPDQRVISSGPYRLVRHPAYTGYLLITTGCGLLSHTWPGLVLLMLLPLVAILRRIQVEEVEMTSVLGKQYSAYSARTRRLVPGVW